MRVEEGNLLPKRNGLFIAGDVRLNENSILTAFQTLFVREHNRICDRLLQENPALND